MNSARIDAILSLVGGGISFTDTATYHDGQTPPSEAEIDAEVIRLQAEYNTQEYARDRTTAYPSTGDQLDYIYHNGVAKWKTDMIDPVKTKYPKG
jgi:hypothetical protein